MKIFKDIFTGDEMFSDTFKVKLIDNVLYEVQGKHETRKDGEVVLAGANASADGQDEGEGAEAGSISGVDIVLDHRLEESFAFGDRKSYTSYLKEYMKKLVEKLEVSAPDQVDVFKTNMNKVMKDILGRFKELQFYTGEKMDIDGMVAIMEYRHEDGKDIPYMLFFKHGLVEEKM